MWDRSSTSIGLGLRSSHKSVATSESLICHSECCVELASRKGRFLNFSKRVFQRTSMNDVEKRCKIHLYSYAALGSHSLNTGSRTFYFHSVSVLQTRNKREILEALHIANNTALNFKTKTLDLRVQRHSFVRVTRRCFFLPVVFHLRCRQLVSYFISILIV